ncbi:hypothetical protein MHEC_04550 [Mycobacterium heckeshornense]|uniref:Uncharacterized protein n=1 Tax=Mycobacterium heckeshornense TaxID=110505 RepID=A0A7R7JE82_9MYCO|nr:hypothetical protein MHEC_04550 [Mycobacterium heckeshornense]
MTDVLSDVESRSELGEFTNWYDTANNPPVLGSVVAGH